MKMKKLTQTTGLSDRTVRYYIDNKVFRPENDNKNYAGRSNFDFTEKDAKQLQQISVLRKYDFSIKEIKALLFEGKDVYLSVNEQIAFAEKECEKQTDQITVLKNAEKMSPNSVTELCELLNKKGTLGDIPKTDVQSPYKPLYEKTKKLNMINYLLYFLLVLGMTGILLLVGLADNEVISIAFEVDAESLPKGTAFIDLLVPMSPDEIGYISQPASETRDINGDVIEFSEDSEIYNYRDSQGYMSYNLHFLRPAQWNYSLMEWKNKTFYYNHYDAEILLCSDKAKVACVSANGDVLAVTNASSIKGLGTLMKVDRLIANGTQLKTERTPNLVYSLAFSLIVLLANIVFSINGAIWLKEKKAKEAEKTNS